MGMTAKTATSSVRDNHSNFVRFAYLAPVKSGGFFFGMPRVSGRCIHFIFIPQSRRTFPVCNSPEAGRVQEDRLAKSRSRKPNSQRLPK
jgi:hypothetical protein